MYRQILSVITSYSIHYTKLYDFFPQFSGINVLGVHRLIGVHRILGSVGGVVYHSTHKVVVDTYRNIGPGYFSGSQLGINKGFGT